ncbi:MAG: ABC transporter ATP-binding protein [Christensenellaceae bacterium]|jgi:ABC-type lipoprotein export system ATPase subunit|nr:ABC transporter ATP-binding protein [Christensenellaceae bacterium]
MTAIILQCISKSFGTKQILSDASLKIQQGAFFAITGASGSGKSTLLNIIGLLDFPDHGEYFWGTQKLSLQDKSCHAKIRNESIGFIFQSYNLLGGYTAKENILLPLLYSKKKKRDTDRFNQIVSSLGLNNILASNVNILSGGEKQRVAIARALINSPTVIICDEPTGNLDAKNATGVLEILKKENDNGVTIVFVTHSSDFDKYYSEKVEIKDGGIQKC